MNQKESFKERVAVQKQFILNQKATKEIETRNTKLIEKQQRQLEQRQIEDEKNKQKKISEEIFKGTGIIECLEEICVDGTLPPNSNKRDSFFGKTLGYKYTGSVVPCFINYNENSLEICIHSFRNADDSCYEGLIISKNENSFNLDYRNTEKNSDSFQLNTQNSEEILDGIARVAAIYQLINRK